MEITDTIGTLLNHKKNKVWTASPDDTVFDAIQTMSQKNVGALPVVDQSGKPIGIVSERDYTRKVILKGKSSQNTLVEQIMTDKLISVTRWETVEMAMRTMTMKKVRHLPVIEDGKIQGIVTTGDLVNWIISAQGAMIEHLESYIRGSYPA